MRISDWSSDVCSSDLRLKDFIEEALIQIRQGTKMAGALPPNEVIMEINTCPERRYIDGKFIEEIIVCDPSPLASRIKITVQMKRSEERLVGKECVSTCRSRCAPDH